MCGCDLRVWNPQVVEGIWPSSPLIEKVLVRTQAKDASIFAPLAYDNETSYSVITMIRTQISLSEAEYEAAKEEARRLGISLAELLRRSLRLTLPTDPSRPWMRYAGMIESGDTRSSQRIDDIVYGQKD
jgi:hypothetical protein